MEYAETTRVPVIQTKSEIETLIAKRGGTGFGYLTQNNDVTVAFRLGGRNIRFDLPIADDATEARKRQRWRALLLVIKAKLESVDGQIETLEEAFLPQVVTPSGETVYEHVRRDIAIIYTEGRDVPLRLTSK